MDVTAERLKKLLRHTQYVVLVFTIHCLSGAMLLSSFLLVTRLTELILEWLYGVPGTGYMRLCLYVVKGALLCADGYLFLLFLYRSVVHAKRDS
ncbi:hypothetical protein [Peristeroidobacter soli]|jgi:hypothetical protein|uniref:hypothetical protein n=1 Tax=Peristeroidobacter soli TaxID=2497877 RepID=UPI001300394D|nr:hypothetical protein [Peristeroidobacter soli]